MFENSLAGGLSLKALELRERPREVYADIIADRAAAVIVAHNHPSGELTPSKEDIAVTKRLGEAGKILGVSLLDHIVFGELGFVSLVELGLY